jgi:hypothetical protein
MDNEINVLDTIIATANFPEHKVLAGDLGAVVEVYSTPSLAYEVEFVNPTARRAADLALLKCAGCQRTYLPHARSFISLIAVSSGLICLFFSPACQPLHDGASARRATASDSQCRLTSLKVTSVAWPCASQCPDQGAHGVSATRSGRTRTAAASGSCGRSSRPLTKPGEVTWSATAP